MSPRTGRPTDDPKTKRMEVRMSVLEDTKLDYCCDIFKMTRAEVIRKGIDMVYQEAQKVVKK